MIELIVIPALEIKGFGEFCKTYGPNAIALDGFVKASPQRSFKNRCINWNHHDGVSRADTYATCAQALTGIRQQAMLMFKQDGDTNVKVYVNDCDEDVCLAWAIIHNFHLHKSPYNPLLNRLVEIENRLDASMGIYPYGVDLPMLKTLEWIYQPYREFVKNGGKNKSIANEFASVIFSVENRINSYLLGNAEELPVDDSYDLVKDYKIGNYRIGQIIQHGSLAKMLACKEGIHIGLTIQSNTLGKNNVTIWSSTPYIPCNIEKLSKRFNFLEKPVIGSWGGGDSICASPRNIGTSLSAEVIWEELIKNIKSNL